MERIDQIENLWKGGIQIYTELTEIIGLKESEANACIKNGEKNRIVISIKGKKECNEYYKKFVKAQYWPRFLKALIFKNMEVDPNEGTFKAHAELKFAQYNERDEKLHVVQMLVSEIDDDYVESLCKRIRMDTMSFAKHNYNNTELDAEAYRDYLEDTWDNYDPNS